ncbi:hypothetical protein [Tepidibacillus decaturensis]|uniref:Uncharacterized protein n=1 Tax=Tepidibacillus decaturensis TaxID=1413211 RepID=A0A135L1V9_9BACI|nr:hypothetical protein [Tepidibacillus decaturensis]KXG42887.1 hypothetical protein U473_01705 [Tepidibacillus decaturensis]
MLIDQNVTYLVVLLALITVLFLLRFLVRKYAKGKIALIMLVVEKKLSTFAAEKASSKEKRLAAERMIVEKFYPLLPAWARLFISVDWLVKQIDILYTEMLDYLDDGENNDSV